MEVGLKVVLGMTVSYLTSLAGMFFAWYHYRKRAKATSEPDRPQEREEDKP